MQIICISRGSYGYGKQLAEELATALGYACLSRDTLIDEATAQGIPVGKIEMAILKKQPLTEELDIQINRFKAFMSLKFCEQARKGSFVYHGRAGHAVLASIPNVLRVRVIADVEDRINSVIQRMNLDRDRARSFIESVDEDIHRWTRSLHGMDWEAPGNYDLTINASHMAMEHGVTLVQTLAGLPEFSILDSVENHLNDLITQAQCLLALGKDERTKDMKVQVSTSGGDTVVTYSPWLENQAKVIPEILSSVSGLKSLVCSVATTNIAYIQEEFDAEDETFQHLVEVAKKWNAAVQVIRYVHTDSLDGEEGNVPLEDPAQAPLQQDNLEDHGGILDDEENLDCSETGCGIPEVMDHLIQSGCAGGVHQVCGAPQALVQELSANEHFSLIAVGSTFVHKAPSVQKRMRRDLIAFLADAFHIPVIETEDLKAQYLFGMRQWSELIGFSAIVALIYFVVMRFQIPILSFLHQEGTMHRVLATGMVVVGVPIAAFIIGGFAHRLLKLVKLE